MTAHQTGIKLLSLGYWVVAIRPGEKRPIGTAWGIERWTRSRLDEEFGRHPDAGIGICFGPQRGPRGEWLIDLEGDGEGASASLASLVGGAAADTVSWYSTRGTHHLFKVNGPRLLGALKSAGAREEKQAPGVWHLEAFPGLEFRVGGFKDDLVTVKQLQSVAPPTPGTDGAPRRWIGPPGVAGVEVIDLPDPAYEALAALGYGRAAIEGETASLAIQSPGERHAGLLASSLRLAGLVKSGSIGEAAALRALHEGARANGMAAEGRADEVDEAWASAMGMAAPRSIRAAPRNGHIERPPAVEGDESLTIGMEDVQEEDIAWILEDRIARKFITIFAGKTSAAKSLAACDIAAHLSRGEAPPFSGKTPGPLRVLFISEDPLRAMLKPRLRAMGAIETRIRFMKWTAMAHFVLSDTSQLDRMYGERPFDLLIIDPPTNFLGTTDEHRNSEVRAMLMVLVVWLELYDVACILITHINKQVGKGLDAVERIIGSVAWASVARITIAFASDPDDEKVIICGGTKNNIGDKAKPVSYRIVRVGKQPTIEWIGVSETSIEDAVNKVKKKTRGICAVEWLTEQFGIKREWDSEDLRRLAAEAGISKNALWSDEVRALPISKRQRTNAMGDRYWVWEAQEGWPRVRFLPDDAGTREPEDRRNDDPGNY